MKSSILLAIAAALVSAAPLESTKSITNTFAEGELESLLPLPATAHYHANSIAASDGDSAAGDVVDITLTSCGAFESTPDATTMYSSVNAIFVAPKIASRPKFNWTRTPETLPRIAVSAGLDGIVCPTTVRAGIYATIHENGTQQHVPFIQFGGGFYGTRIANVQPDEHVHVTITLVQDDVVNIRWNNLNRTEQAFDKNVHAGDIMCGRTVSWYVHDIVPAHASPGDYFAAFEPVHFQTLDSDQMDGSTVHFSSATANFTAEKAFCKVEQAGNEMTVTSI